MEVAPARRPGLGSRRLAPTSCPPVRPRHDLEENFFEKFFDDRPLSGPDRKWETAGASEGGLGQGDS